MSMRASPWARTVDTPETDPRQQYGHPQYSLDSAGVYNLICTFDCEVYPGGIVGGNGQYRLQWKIDDDDGSLTFMEAESNTPVDWPYKYALDRAASDWYRIKGRAGP